MKSVKHVVQTRYQSYQTGRRVLYSKSKNLQSSATAKASVMVMLTKI